MSGSSVLSKELYAGNGLFEFNMTPSMSDGVVTVIGLANDGVNKQDPFIQLVFDFTSFGADTFAVQLGGGLLFGDNDSSKTYAVNVSSIIYPNNDQLISFNLTALRYQILRTTTDFQVNIGYMVNNELTFTNVFATVDMIIDFSQFQTAFPYRFNVHAASWYNKVATQTYNYSDPVNTGAGYAIQQSTIFEYRYITMTGVVQEDYLFNTPTL